MTIAMFSVRKRLRYNTIYCIIICWLFLPNVQNSCLRKFRFVELIQAKYSTIASGFQPSLSGVDSGSKSCSVYTARHCLLVTDGPQAPSTSTQRRPMHKPPLASAVYTGRGKLMAEPSLPRRAHGSTTDRLRVMSKCALSREPIREECAGHPPDAPASVPSCWSITALPARVIHHK